MSKHHFSKNMESDKALKIKVCGMRDPENIDAVCAARPDYLGFIFYPKSKRYVGEKPDPAIFARVPSEIEKVGVFVNDEPNVVIDSCQQFGLAVAQLHGSETPDYCGAVKKAGLTVFKAFSIDEDFDFGLLESYSKMVDFFLFDTKGRLPGGTGEKFNWQLLDHYTDNVPFFLSGGIGPGDAPEIRNISHPQLFGIDINSGFELKPALKDARKTAKFVKEVRDFGIKRNDTGN
ncbi:phosphoribosylanthranilate isomerase [Gaoshiqia sediminis]|uniref:N-(5'-phosphoribosyl)anthranilate isomerase n=1 Tax=Gaoshiqia sediminis TaxID=2986998 RepID=A0AA42C955_9BACT|nr:phosphoribosylanthranilate isomerase [Gaoshiqia sediminis]MCW0481685.1 phosphoribosylanthranilate isomerase [Gaoshiqia sediminis]